MTAKFFGNKTILVFSTLALITAQVGLSSLAIAQDVKTAPATNEPSTTSEEMAPMCSTKFVQLFGMTVRELQMVAAYFSSNELSPNLADAVALCDKVATEYPGHVCRVTKAPRKTATDDLVRTCAGVTELARKLQIGPLPKTSMILMPPESVIFNVRDEDAFTKLLEKPRSRFIIDGKIFEEVESGMKSAQVRCSFDKHSNETQSFMADLIFKFQAAQQSWVGNFRITALSFAEKGLVLGCLTDAHQPLTVELLQKAFGPVADVVVSTPTQSLK